MKVKMKPGCTAAHPDWTAAENTTVDLPDDAAQGLIDGGYAEAIAEPEGETASAPPAGEAAVKPDPKAETTAKDPKVQVAKPRA